MRNRLSEPASRRFLAPALWAGPGASFLNDFAAPPPAWGDKKLVLRNPGLRPPPGLEILGGWGYAPGFLIRRFVIRVPGCVTNGLGSGETPRVLVGVAAECLGDLLLPW